MSEEAKANLQVRIILVVSGGKIERFIKTGVLQLKLNDAMKRISEDLPSIQGFAVLPTSEYSPESNKA